MGPKRTTWTYWRGDWHEGDVRILGAASHATWLGSLVFDGARLFEANAGTPLSADFVKEFGEGLDKAESRAVLDQLCDLVEAPEALKLLAARKSTGKIVLTVGG